jgi:hypothetical protein
LHPLQVPTAYLKALDGAQEKAPCGYAQRVSSEKILRSGQAVLANISYSS